ncbi:hypothetical protein ANANG_G00225180 [Anguilla anguilla]|uniref:Uncharacterized protein n=1 Tax=Anguilla anguilla TaxID=7936 RepID=A0A9D3M0K5_ANGAN|nr:hypothetical protein ANANG_G00225180 [Anguilla anguilla]
MRLFCLIISPKCCPSVGSLPFLTCRRLCRNQAVPSLKRDRPQDVSVRSSLLPTSASVSVHWWCPVLVLSCRINKNAIGLRSFTDLLGFLLCSVAWEPEA